MSGGDPEVGVTKTNERGGLKESALGLKGWEWGDQRGESEWIGRALVTQRRVGGTGGRGFVRCEQHVLLTVRIRTRFWKASRVAGIISKAATFFVSLIFSQPSTSAPPLPPPPPFRDLFLRVFLELIPNLRALCFVPRPPMWKFGNSKRKTKINFFSARNDITEKGNVYFCNEGQDRVSNRKRRSKSVYMYRNQIKGGGGCRTSFWIHIHWVYLRAAGPMFIPAKPSTKRNLKRRVLSRPADHRPSIQHPQTLPLRGGGERKRERSLC